MKHSLLIMLCIIFSLLTEGTQAKTFNQIHFHGFSPQDTDAQKGLEQLLNGDAFHYAIPLSTLTYLQTTLGYQTPEQQFQVFGRLPSPPNRITDINNQSLSLSIFERKDNIGNSYKFANSNCFQCHAGIANGQVIAGLGNTHIDQASLAFLASGIIQYTESGFYRLLQPNLSELEIKNLIEFANDNTTRIQTTYPHATSKGQNFGPLAIWFLIKSFIDPATHGLKSRPVAEQTPFDYLFFNYDGSPKKLPTIDPNPWWLYKYKESIYRYQDLVPLFHRAAHFSINFTSIHDEANENHLKHVNDVKSILNFVNQTVSPVYPDQLEANQVEAGRALFHGEHMPDDGEALTCHRCHGQYIRHADFPDLSQAGGWWVKYKDKLKDVKTDSKYNETLQSYQPLIEHMAKIQAFEDFQNTPELLPISSVPDKPGYLPPPLDGVYISAPYFHNGSVPTIEAVLNSTIRPTYWARDVYDPYAYDLKNLGLRYKVITKTEYQKWQQAAEYMPTLSQTALKFRTIFDTTDYGRGNQGHQFGDKLTDDERFAIIEFLKSLSGPNMFVYGNQNK